MSDKYSFEQITTHLQTTGYVYQGSAIYGGLSNTWEYGPLGAELKRNIRDAWWIVTFPGVTIMLEPLNTYVNHPGYYLTSSAEAFDIIRTVDHPLVKIVFDIYHQQIMEGNIIPNITNNLDCIAHLHAAGHPGRNELQFGENDYKVIFQAVEKAGYNGYCGLEYKPLLDPLESMRLAREIYG